MTPVVDSLSTEQSIGQDTELTNTVDKNYVVGTMTEAGEMETKTKPRPKSCGGRKHMENRENLKTFLSKALSQVLNYCLIKYRNTMTETGTEMEDLECVSGAGSISDLWNNSKRVHTTMFRYPSNKRHYIVLAQDSFADIICG